jgi:hypothetical protein
MYMYYTSNFKIPSLNNSRFGNFVDLIELEIKDTTGTDRSASFLDLHLKIDSEGRLNFCRHSLMYVTTVFSTTPHKLSNVHQCHNK